MAGETPELTLEQPPQDASTKKLSECLRRIGDELDSNMELQRCGSWDLGSIKECPATSGTLPRDWVSSPQFRSSVLGMEARACVHDRPALYP